MALKCDITLDEFARQLDRLLEGNNPRGLEEFLGVTAIAEISDWQDQLRRIRDIISVMRVHERRNPNHLDVDQILRIAMLSGAKPVDVTEFLRQFGELREKLAEALGGRDH